MANILVCDDERSICELLEIALRKEGHRIETVNSGDAARRKLDSALYDLVLTDVKMPNVTGIDVLKHSRRVSPETAVVLITAIEDVHTAIQAVKEGAADYIQKGPDLLEAIRVAIKNVLDKQTLRRQNFALRRDAGSRNSLENIIGSSSAVRKLKETIRTVASTGSTIVIHGESGTGKELVARAVHACSPRAADPFVSVNCGAFPETLLESELFGYVKGAFTGANQNKRGLFEMAIGGTIFLDEISEMTPAMQVKLLRVLQERCLRPVGGTEEIAVDVRVIAATNKDLSRMVGEGAFREDLYYRVSVIPIEVPPLRERSEDVPLLAAHFLKKYAPAAGKSITRITAEALQDLTSYDWPGNVRQLENTIERAVAMETSSELHVELPADRHRVRPNSNGNGNGNSTSIHAGAEPLPIPPQQLPNDGVDLERYIAGMERSLIQTALRQSNGVQTRAAEMLKLSYRSFRHLVKKYDI
jgi:two-component system response regulator PilR (NtrC family)